MSADLHHLAAAYALDALDEVERRRFESHYPTCEICSSEVAEFRDVAAALAQAASVPPPAGLKSAVMREIATTRQLSPLVTTTKRGPNLSRRMVLAAAAALVLLAGVLVVTLPDSQTDATNEVVQATDAIVTPLDPLTGLEGNLQVIWSNELDQVVVVGSRLDDLDAQLAYALWFLLDDGSVAPAALFRPEGGSVSEVFDIDDLDTTGWGITIEPAGGSDQPTTDVIYAGTL